MSMQVALIFLLVLGVGGCLAYFSHQAEKKRRAALAEWAQRMGLRFFPEKDASFSDTFGAFPGLNTGSRRYAHYQMVGEIKGTQILICEYHYETYSRNSKGHRTTHHHWSTLVFLKPDFLLKPLVIRREGLFDRMKGAFGWDDIDFSSAEFSQAYHVNAPDRDWAFAVIQPRTMDLLMRSRDLEFHMQQGWLLLRCQRKMQIGKIQSSLEKGQELLALIPDFCRQPS